MIAEWSRERPELDLAPVAVIARLGRASRLVNASVEETFGRYGLNRAGWDVIAALRRAGPPFRRSPTELYRALVCTSGAMTNRLQRLEAAGLVTRVADDDDRRSRLVELTPDGRALADEVVGAHLATQARVLRSLDAGEREELATLLAKLAAGLEAG